MVLVDRCNICTIMCDREPSGVVGVGCRMVRVNEDVDRWGEYIV